MIQGAAAIHAAISRALAPRRAITVSQWADAHRILSSKGSQEPGRWRTSRNPPLREPMDCFSARSPVRDVVLMFPIQFGKTEVLMNALAYTMCESPGPIMVCLPSEVTMHKWIAQKLSPMIESTPEVQRVLTSMASRDAANSRTFKDFDGGQLYIEHAGTPGRLKMVSVRTLLVDELDEFANRLSSGDDPVAMLEGRTSAFPATYKRAYISTPGIRGVSRTEQLWEKSDQRRYYVPCPHCGHRQPLEWRGLHYTPDGSQCWYVCRECGACIEEHHKTSMIAAGEWVPENPAGTMRGYHINCLYYQLGLGPRWLDLVRMWREAQSDPAKLKTFVNDRLAEPWDDPAMRAVRHNVIADRAEPVPLRPVPEWVLAVTVGIDTQDNRLAVQLLGWGRGMVCWPIDYVELPGDPADDPVWDSLTDLLSRPIERKDGALLWVDAGLIDIGGHRTEAVKAFVRSGRVRRLLAGFGATANNAPVLGKGKAADVNWRGRMDPRGVQIHQVGTVAIKHLLYSWLSADADREPEHRRVRFSEQLSSDYFGGLVSETYNPTKNRFEPRRGAPRNEPLDTWVYAYAATHHPAVRLHRWTKADWDTREAMLRAATGAESQAQASGEPARPAPPSQGQAPAPPRPQGAPAGQSAFRRQW
jgi:phage terminase large subunit GpA-like protein